MRAAVAALIFVMGCGARTGLDAPDAAPGETPTQPWLMFDLFDGEGGIRLYVIHADGSDGHAIDLAGHHPMYPTFSPDARSMLYVEYDPSPSERASLVVMDLASGATRTVARGMGLSAASVSRDGLHIAYTSNLDVRVVDWNGANDRLLVQGPFDAGCCSWGYGHPGFVGSSHTILFATAGIVGAIDIDGSHRRQILTEDFTRIVFPNVAISPDATQFAAGAACGGELALRIYDLEAPSLQCDSGAMVAPVVESIVGNESNNPAWGPNGMLAFQQDRNVYVVPASGGVPLNLTRDLAHDPASAAYPVWVPLHARLP
jgi:hypothetical protein